MNFRNYKLVDSVDSIRHEIVKHLLAHSLKQR